MFHKSELSNFMIKYLGEIETVFDNALACLSEAQMGMKIKTEVGNLFTHTLLKQAVGVSFVIR